jgi:XRE family aerobic/anaerobic benzoate catabolism transcriptional regulator
MQRVLRQGDLRPMAASSEAMADLRRILVSRSAFYGKADFSFMTSGQEIGPAFAALRRSVRGALGLPL